MTSLSLLLTIGIPTWNRSSILPEMVLSICRQADGLQLSGDIEIIISDNSSTDDTPAVVEQLQQTRAISIRYHRNEVNMGVAYNILKTVELARGEYWMFYGDDDLLPSGQLTSLLSVIAAHRDIPVFVFQSDSSPSPHIMPSETRACTMTAIAEAYLYHMGNAGLQAIKTAAAQQVLLQQDTSQFQSAWPQTELAFQVMANSGLTKPALVTPVVSVASPNHRQHTTYTAWYISHSAVFSLYDLATRLRRFTDEGVFDAACAFIFEQKRILYLAKMMLLYSAYSDLPNEVINVRQAAWKSVWRATPHTIIPLVFLWLVVASPRMIQLGFLRVVRFLPVSAARKLNTSIKTMKQYAQDRRSAEAGAASKRRIYNPGDI